MRTYRVISTTVAAATLGFGLVAPVSAQQPPPSFPDVEGHQPNIVYRDIAGHIHVVRFRDYSNGAPRSDAGDFDISAPAWPKATGTPSGYSSAIDPLNPEEHVVYRSGTGHVIELWKRVADTTWQETDLTAAAATKARAAGDPLGWSHDTVGREWVVYRAVNDQIHALTRSKATGRWTDVNLSHAAGTKALAGADPTQFIDSVSATPRPVLIYKSQDQHVHLLIWRVTASALTWHDTDVSKLAGWVRNARGRPYGFASTTPASATRQLHVVLVAGYEHIHELYGGFGHPWKHHDLTVLTKTKGRARSDVVQGTVGTDELSQDFEAVQYKDDNFMLHRMYYSAGGAWTDVAQYTVSRVLLWFQDGDNAYTTYLGGMHLRVSEQQWKAENTDVSDLTTAFAATTYPAPGSGTGGYFTPEP